MLTINKILFTDLTLELQQNEEVYIQIAGYLSSCVIGILIEADGAAIIQSTLASTEYFELPNTTHSDILWENIHILGVEYPEVTFSVLSSIFTSPNILYIKNSSTTEKAVKIDLRGNR
jgi:hypothetical protein